jgi:hypothetical protein
VSEEGACRPWGARGGCRGPRNGEPDYWQGYYIDITEQKQAEEALRQALERERQALERERQAARELRALDEMKNTFLDAVSHELRTPLATVIGIGLTLQRAGSSLAPEDAADLAALVARIAQEWRLRSGRELEVLAEPVVAWVDPAKVERVVENLLANAGRHGSSPSARPWRVSPRARGRHRPLPGRPLRRAPRRPSLGPGPPRRRRVLPGPAPGSGRRGRRPQLSPGSPSGVTASP